MILRALSVRQPWAWAIVQGLKPWENRPRRFNYRGPLLIHASKTVVRSDYESACDFIERLSGLRPPTQGELGGIVGAAVLTNCVEPLARDRGWRCAGQFGLRFECVTALPLRPIRGALGMFKVQLTPREIEHLQSAGVGWAPQRKT